MTAMVLRQDASAGSPSGHSAADFVVASVAAVFAFGVYLATLYPGLLDVGDAAKFSFVGKVLGIPHAPGYPLYVMVSHLFSYVPFGTLAYRMNALSALFGALTVALVYLIARRLGTGRMAAVSVALALAFGNAFWSRALYAKGYTLNAAIVSAGILALLRWNETRRTRDLYWAAGFFALSVGDHLTVVALVPAVLAFSLMTDPRLVLRPRLILIVLAIALLGFAQYGLIIVRTLQHAPYLEARATNLHELWAVMTARRFAHEIGAYSWPALWSTRMPIVAGLVRTELGYVGLLLSAVGFVWLLLRVPRHALLFGLGALGVVSLTANMSSAEDQGFLLSAFVLLWPVAGVGFERLVGMLKGAPRRLAVGLAIGVAALVPSSQIVQNYRANDHRAETFESAYFDALFAALPQKAAIVNEEYRIDMMVLYKLLGERANGARDIRPVPCDADSVIRRHDQGAEIFAFVSARNRLAEQGFRFVPFDLPARGLGTGAVFRREIFRLASAGSCLDIGNRGWVDITRTLQPNGRLSVRIDNYRAFDSSVTIYAGADTPLVPVLVDMAGVGAPTLKVETFARGDAEARRRLASHRAADVAGLSDEVLGARYVIRADVRVNDRGAYSVFGLDFGGGPKAASARALVDRDNAKRAVVCTHELGEVDAWPAVQQGIALRPNATTVHFADGWYPLERRVDGTLFRWTTNHAVLVVPLGRPRAATVTITAEPLNYPGRKDGKLTLVVNDYRLDSRVLRTSPSALAWMVPAERWRAGLNEIVIEVEGARRPSDAGLSSDGRLLGVSVTEIELAAAPAGRR